MIVKMNGPQGARQLRDHVEASIFHQRDDAEGWWITLTHETGRIETLPIEGNIFVMNNDGITVDRFILERK